MTGTTLVDPGVHRLDREITHAEGEVARREDEQRFRRRWLAGHPD